MKNLIWGLAVLLLLSSCSAKKINGQQEIQDSSSINKPQTKIKVNKEYDENGNLVKFDSTYSYYYSNLGSDSTSGDSTYDLFQQDFFNSFPNIQRPFLNDMFFDDSLLTYDFYKDDFFSKRFRSNRMRFDKLFEEMDSVKNKFYKQYEKQDEKRKTKDP